MSDKYEELRQLAEKATQGPWRVDGSVVRGQNTDLNIFHVPVGLVNDAPYPGCPSRREAKANAGYIAAANPATITALLAERDALLEELNNLEVAANTAGYCWRTPSAQGRFAEAMERLRESAIKAAKRQEGV